MTGGKISVSADEVGTWVKLDGACFFLDVISWKALRETGELVFLEGWC